MNIKQIMRSFLATALWSEIDEKGHAFGARYSRNDFDPEDVSTAESIVRDFLNNPDVSACLSQAQAKYGYRGELIGHDLWLSMAGHQLGFLYRGLGEIGLKLTLIAKTYGERTVYVGGDGKLHICCIEATGKRR